MLVHAIKNACIINFLIFAICACKKRDSDSETSQIFYRSEDSARGDVSQRRGARPEEFPYILTVGNKCTGFLISPDFEYAMSANHCGIKVNDSVCFAAQALKDSHCDQPGIVSEIVDSSKSYIYDYAILRIRWVDPLPSTAKFLRLEDHNNISQLKEDASRVELIGYPADKYAKGVLSISHCKLRAGINEARDKRRDDAVAFLLQSWQTNRKYRQDPEYEAMRDECYTFNTERRTFRADCSVYGGNSGGPLIDSVSGRAIAMPATFFPETVKASKCYGKYWEKFFWPIWHPNDAEHKFKPPPEAKNHWATRWDNLDREKSPIEDLPEFIPVFEMVRASAFLQSNAEIFGISGPQEN
jgi:hypothetical protein